MNFLNEDFSEAGPGSTSTAEEFRNHYLSSVQVQDTAPSYASTWTSPPEDGRDMAKAGVMGTLFWNTIVLCERSTINYARNLLAYGVRAGMYAGVYFRQFRYDLQLMLSRHGIDVGVSHGHLIEHL